LETAISRYLPISQSNLEKRFLLNNLEGGIKTDNSQLLNVNPSKPAPELTGLDSWINSDPQTIQNLKGKVVLVDFWTYSCINCIVTQPYLNAWHDEYQDDGLVILGIHAPEFSFEKKRENVEKAVIDAKIEYPVALDNDFETWNAFENRFWPAKYLIDKDGNIRYYHAGEGDYEETEKAIQALLGIDQQLSTNNIPEIDRVSTKQTPETYLGWSREENYARRRDIKENESANYESDGITLESNQWILDGQFNVKNEGVLSERDNNRLKINFTAKDVYLVAGNEINSGVIEVLLNGNPIAISPNQKGANVNGQSQVTIDSDKTYHLVSFDSLKENQTLELIIPNGVRVNVFTFGSN
jgi:thiol-disulfide isomerase/thioredoxin